MRRLTRDGTSVSRTRKIGLIEGDGIEVEKFALYCLETIGLTTSTYHER